MKNSFLISIFLLIVLFGSCHHPTPKECFNDLQQIEGNWTSYEGPRFNEYWEKINDSLMKGIGFSLNGPDAVFSEQLIIKQSGDSMYYGALVAENKGFIYFKLEKAGRRYWKFVNTAHDYPNIIEYKMRNDTLMETNTSNIRGNKKVVFKLRKVPL